MLSFDTKKCCIGLGLAIHSYMLPNLSTSKSGYLLLGKEFKSSWKFGVVRRSSTLHTTMLKSKFDLWGGGGGGGMGSCFLLMLIKRGSYLE